MPQQDRIWSLLCRYLTGEASAAEIKELQEITSNDAVSKNSVDMLCHFWQTETVPDKTELKKAWDKHVKRMD